ncbi:hypothetical protein LIER_28931 [Lithospermum erythrorhizon]|uniref:SAP domain-containing protein n=1 Tax=Lithospermum erythrorhizon TaxID=34254 RepID=A0AAV3RLN7_LITER
MSSPYPVLDGRPIDQWRVTELKEELKRRKLTTKGLKEDLVKRLSRELFSEPNTNEDADNGSDNIPKSDIQFEEDEKRPQLINDGVVASQPEVVFEEGKSETLVSRTAEAGIGSGTNTIQMVDMNSMKEDEGNLGSVVDEKYQKENVVGSLSTEDNHQEAEIFIQEPAVVKEENAVVKGDVADVVSANQLDLNHGRSEDENTNMKPELGSGILLESQSEDNKPIFLRADDGDSRSAHPSLLTVASGPNNQVPEVSLSVGVQLKSDFSSTESGSINEKNELDNNINDVLRLQVGAKPEMVQLSSSTAAICSMESSPVDVEVVQEKKLLLEEKDGDIAKTVDFIKNQDSGDSGSPEKLNLDRSSGDDFMEEDVLESKQNSGSDSLVQKVEDIDPSLGSEKSNIVDVVDMSLDTKIADMENENKSAAVSSKRKIHDKSAVENADMAKRQRRTQPDVLKLPREQSASTVAFINCKDAAHPTVRGGFSKHESADSEAPKERVVPPSAKPPTNSLRIDRFLRPFTLKAVQDLLGKTGTVVSFWMDNIKTHCFVTYSSVEEAMETRNAVYNLQWPSNGGRLLIADFVDPLEVKARVEGPLPSPMTPTTPAGLRLNFPSAQPAGPPQPSPRQQVLRHQLPPPPPVLTNPLAAREKVLPIKKQLAPVKEQLIPPPPPVSEKVDPPALTLDDLFRKTRASPRIYYQPLSDEQVAAKLNVQGNNINQ